MPFYRKWTQGEGSKKRYFIIVTLPNGEDVDVEVKKAIADALDELQRESWLLRKRDQRHGAHLDAIPEHMLPARSYVPSPERLLLEQEASDDLAAAFMQIPAKQRRRMLMRHVFGLPAKEIAKIERCSVRSVNCSLRLAKKNLRDLLGDDFQTQ